MKKFLTIICLCALTAVACHKEEYVAPTAERQGLTSLTAYFAFGPYEDLELAKLDVTDPDQERFVIPVPWYYPASSDDQTMQYMIRVRVRAEIQPNYTISPALSLLDLTEENVFTLTDPNGKSRRIIITGQRTRSSECDILAFNLTDPAVTGVVDKETKTVTLPTKEDVSNAIASAVLSPHATISPDPAEARDYTEPVTFTVTADNGTSTCEYTVAVGEPQRIPTGVDFSSIKHKFNIDPVAILGLSPYSEMAYISLASIQDKLVISEGMGNDPVIVNPLSATVEGSLPAGGFNIGAITNDEAGHLIAVNPALGGGSAETVTIAMTSSLSEAPATLFSFTNPASEPVGHRVKVMGDVTDEAVITLTCEGVNGVTTTAKAVYVVVSGGQMISANVVDFAASTPGWGAAPVNIGTVVPASINPASDGWYYDYYEGNSDDSGMYLLHYNKKGSDKIAGWFGDWSLNPNCLDSKQFNKARFMSLLVVSHFPHWGVGPRLYVWDVTDPDIASPSPKTPDFSNEWIEWYQQGDAGCASGDVVMAPSTDGYFLNIYYYDHNSQAVGLYAVDCIKR